MAQPESHNSRYLPIEDYALIGDLHTVALRQKWLDRLVLPTTLRLA
jgi:hypothetical protein